VILIVDRFLLLRRERGASGHAHDQQDCEQELFHVSLHFDSWEVVFGASESHRRHNARPGPVRVYSSRAGRRFSPAALVAGSGLGYDYLNDASAADEGANRL